MGVPQNKREAEKAVKEAFQEVQERQDALDHFARICKLVHDRHLLSDIEIARVIDNGYSRSNIYVLRKKVE